MERLLAIYVHNVLDGHPVFFINLRITRLIRAQSFWIRLGSMPLRSNSELYDLSLASNCDSDVACKWLAFSLNSLVDLQLGFTSRWARFRIQFAVEVETAFGDLCLAWIFIFVLFGFGLHLVPNCFGL